MSNVSSDRRRRSVRRECHLGGAGDPLCHDRVVAFPGGERAAAAVGPDYGEGASALDHVALHHREGARGLLQSGDRVSGLATMASIMITESTTIVARDRIAAATSWACGGHDRQGGRQTRPRMAPYGPALAKGPSGGDRVAISRGSKACSSCSFGCSGMPTTACLHVGDEPQRHDVHGQCDQQRLRAHDQTGHYLGPARPPRATDVAIKAGPRTMSLASVIQCMPRRHIM